MTDLKACRYVVARPFDGHEYGDYEVIDSESQTRIAQCARQRQADMIADALNTRADQGDEAVGEIVHAYLPCTSRVVMFDVDYPIGTKLYTHPPRATADEVRDAAAFHRLIALRDQWERDEREHLNTFGQHLPASVVCLVEQFDATVAETPGASHD